MPKSSFKDKLQSTADQAHSGTETNLWGEEAGGFGRSPGFLSAASLRGGSPVFSYPVPRQAVTVSAPYQVTASTSTAASATPSWVSQLSTASIRSDMSAAIVGGQVTYSGLLKLLNDVASSLYRTRLSTRQFTDLKTIASNLNNGVTTSAYLTGIMNGLVMGSPANAAWTGGGAYSVRLGNLAAGATATQLSELIGKWFLGTDLPSSQVSLSGASTFQVSYSYGQGSLFGAAGPNWNDVNQGYLGDCYLESSLAEVAYKNPSMIASMITDNGNGTYGIRFYVNNAAQYVTVNTALANGGTIFNYGANLWASLIEKGYAQLQASGVCTGNTVNYGNSWTTIGNGGMAEYALEEITGSATITDFCASQGSWNSYTYNSSLSLTASSAGNSSAAIQNILISDLNAGDDVILSSWTNATDSAGKTTLVAAHAMSVYGFDTATGMFEIRNPWGTAPGQSWDTNFEVSLQTLLAAGDTITVDSIGGSAATAAFKAAPAVTAHTAAQYNANTALLTQAMATMTGAQHPGAVNVLQPIQSQQNQLFAPKA